MDCDSMGLTRLDRQIERLLKLGMDVTCVLAGRRADEQLRHCRNIARVDMAFDDTPESLLGLTSNVKAGLTAIGRDTACFALPVEIPCPAAPVWEFLKEGWRATGMEPSISVVQATDAQGAPWHFGFPVLITRQGHRHIMSLQGLTSMADKRLKYLHLSYNAAANLASDAKDL